MSIQLTEKYGALGDSEEKFLIELLFALTIAYRAAGDGGCSPRDLVHLNEINHALLNRLRDIRAGESWTSSDFIVKKISHHIEKAPSISGDLRWAIGSAFANVDA